jgi:hypothetical protein
MKARFTAGDRIGRLTILGRAPNRRTPNGSHRTEWLVRCDCGTEKIVSGSNLTPAAKTRSCGCLWLERRSGPNSNLFRGGLLQAEFHRQAATAIAKRGLTWSLTQEEFARLVSAKCSYCGAEAQSDNRGLVRNGIDRIDSSRGYELMNCATACARCNRMKGSASRADFITHCARVAAHAKES